MTIILIVTIILVAFLLLSSIRVVEESQRMIVFRRGLFFSIVGPGLVLLIPLLEKGLRVNLAEKVSGWEELSKEQLENEIKKLPEIGMT